MNTVQAETITLIKSKGKFHFISLFFVRVFSLFFLTLFININLILEIWFYGCYHAPKMRNFCIKHESPFNVLTAFSKYLDQYSVGVRFACWLVGRKLHYCAPLLLHMEKWPFYEMIMWCMVCIAKMKWILLLKSKINWTFPPCVTTIRKDWTRKTFYPHSLLKHLCSTFRQVFSCFSFSASTNTIRAKSLSVNRVDEWLYYRKYLWSRQSEKHSKRSWSIIWWHTVYHFDELNTNCLTTDRVSRFLFSVLNGIFRFVNCCYIYIYILFHLHLDFVFRHLTKSMKYLCIL